jgi:hypothetical protein
MAKTAWMKHLMSVKHKHPKLSLGEAMKLAKKSYKKGGADEEERKETAGDLVEMHDAVMEGGQLMGKGTVAGGRRRKTRKTRKMKGGQLYTQAGGPYTGSVLSDGAAPFKPYDLSSMQFPGANPAAMTAGRRRKTRRHTRKHRA